MPALDLVDRYTSTLGSSYTSGGSSLTLSGAVPLADGTRNFYLIVEAEGGNSEEVFLVTALGSSGTVATVTGAQAGTSASNHASGAIVIGSIMTKDAYTQLKTDAGGGGGSLVLLEEHTASSSSSLVFTTRNVVGQSGATIQSDYDDYEIRVSNIIPATNATIFQARMSTDGGSTYDSTSGHYLTSNWWIWVSGGTAAGGTAGGTTQINILDTVSNSASRGISGVFRLVNPGGSVYKMFHGNGVYCDSNNSSTIDGFSESGCYAITTAVDAFEFFFSSGNIASGTIRVYGVAK